MGAEISPHPVILFVPDRGRRSSVVPYGYGPQAPLGPSPVDEAIAIATGWELIP